ncbi:MAG: hypothetical protein R3A48_21360 [Polyangiales bacterium]
MNRAILSIPWAVCMAYGLSACSADPGGADGGTTPTALTQTPPLKRPLTPNEPVRTLVLRHEERAGAMRRDTQCGLTALLFNTTSTATVTAATIDGATGCRLYVADPDVDLQAQRWLCAGALNVSSGALNTNFSLCPSPGARVTFDAPLLGCGSIANDRAAAIASMMEIDGDQLTDLTATVRFPAAVRITAPNELGIGSWPANGPLEVRWTSAGATSALVTIEPETPTATSPRIYCPAVLNGFLQVPAGMIDQVGLRNLDARLKVWSFTDGTAMAETGNTYRVSGAMVTNYSLQGRR